MKTLSANIELFFSPIKLSELTPIITSSRPGVSNSFSTVGHMQPTLKWGQTSESVKLNVIPEIF